MKSFRYHFVSALKAFIVVSTGAIIAYKTVNKIYDLDYCLYVFVGIGGYMGLSMFQEELKNDKSKNRRKRN